MVEWEGEPRVVDTVLGAALGYERADRIRDMVSRKRDLFLGAGNLPTRAANYRNAGAGRPGREFLLNREQVNLAILLCGLPNVDGIKAHVAKVFTAWEEGRLKAADLETAVALQDSAEAAEGGKQRQTAAAFHSVQPAMALRVGRIRRRIWRAAAP